MILVNRGKKAAVPLPVRDVRHDQVGHLPDPQHDKNRMSYEVQNIFVYTALSF